MVKRRAAKITVEEKRDEGEGSEGGEKRRKVKEGLVSRRVYFTKVAVLPDELNLCSFSLCELLECIRPILSLHFNFCVDVDFLLNQYPSSFSSFPITIVVGDRSSAGSTPAQLRREIKGMKVDNITVAGARLPIPFGVHHSKLSLFEDGDGAVHVIVGTANLIENDWEAKTQMFYYAKGVIKEQEVKDNPLFVNDLIDYLTAYNLPDTIEYWLNRLKYARFEETKNRLIGSYPGYHKGKEKEKVGHLAVKSILKEFNKEDKDDSKMLIFQASSIGSLGAKPSTWLEPQLTMSLRGGKSIDGTRCYLIFPSVNDVKNSIEGFAGGGSLPYKKETSERQEWLNGRMCRWRSEKWGRSRAIPHVKTYTQINSNREIDWEIVTSANLSKAAWGEEQKEKTQLMIRSYEVGVLLLDKDSFRLPYDYPIAKYQSGDKPWVIDDIDKLILEEVTGST